MPMGIQIGKNNQSLVPFYGRNFWPGSWTICRHSFKTDVFSFSKYLSFAAMFELSEYSYVIILMGDR